MELKRKERKEIKISPVYSRTLITRKIIFPITSIGKNLNEIIEQYISFNYEGKCSIEGFIKPNSTKINTYSSGIIKKGNQVSFDVIFECEVCFPVEGTIITCIAKENTKAGIKAESVYENPSPIIAFIAKDHNISNSYFSTIKENDIINVRVIGQRFELNDQYVSVIGMLVKPKT